MRLIAILLIVVMSVSAGLFVNSLTKKEAQEPEVKIVEVPVPEVREDLRTVDIMVARERIPVGMAISPSLVDYKPWPEHLMLSGFIETDGKGDVDVMGHVARSEFNVGEPILMSKLANPEDPNFLASALEKGMRAITISVDVISGVGGFIYPGDRVDVLVTHDVDTGEERKLTGQVLSEPISEILVPDVKVVAVDQRTSTEGSAGPSTANTMTLAVAPTDAQRIRLAERNGKLSLVLRSLKQQASNEEGGASAEPEAMVTPSGTGDLSRITPPSYFPVLYDFNSGYTPIEIKAEDNAEAPAADPAMMSAIPAQSKMSGRPETDVKLVRGSQAETVGITRP